MESHGYIFLEKVIINESMGKNQMTKGGKPKWISIKKNTRFQRDDILVKKFSKRTQEKIRTGSGTKKH